MKISIQDLQQRYWPILGYLPQSLLKNVRLVYVPGLTGSDVILVTNDHKVFFYGLNRNLIPSRAHDGSSVIEIKELSQKRVKGFACNSYHCTESTELSMMVYCSSGEVYLWGYNTAVMNGEILNTPFLIGGLPKTVVEVACGHMHYLALTSDRMVYAWGDNAYGQAARKLTELVVSHPRRISFPFGDIEEIACGTAFSVAVTCERKVFGWGKNTAGELGENKESEYGPVIRELPAFKNISVQQIACGESHILALNDGGVLFSCGGNVCGQLGETSLRFKKIAVSGSSSVGETLEGDIMVWGYIDGGNIYSPMKTPCRSVNEAFAVYRLGGMYEPFELTPEGENGAETVAETVRKSFGNPDTARCNQSNNSDKLGMRVFKCSLDRPDRPSKLFFASVAHRCKIKKTSDFKIIVQEKEIHVHKYILALRSKYFECMFANNWSEEKTSCIKMDESYEGMSAFLKYLYTDEIDNNDLKVLIDVALIAEKYCELNLVTLCIKQFESGLNPSNVAELYELTLDQRLSNFNNLCINYASRYLSVVVASSGFESWNSETFKNFFKHDKVRSALTTSS